MKIGCHVSVSGGIEKSVIRANNLGINTMQIFSKNSLAWKEKTYTPEEINVFQKHLVEYNIHPIFVHASYLINLASPDEKIYQKSIYAFIKEIKRTESLLKNLYQPYVIIHPGAHRGTGEKNGLERIINALNVVFEEINFLNLKTMILLENTSGSGTTLGYHFRQLKNIIRGVHNNNKVGICIDTCHAFAAGYNLSSTEGLKKMITDLEDIIGLEKLMVIHLNDSKYPLDSRKDRHMHIGQGYIGEAGFRNIINHPFFRNLPFILETPKESDEDDRKNIRLIRKMKYNCLN